MLNMLTLLAIAYRNGLFPIYRIDSNCRQQPLAMSIATISHWETMVLPAIRSTTYFNEDRRSTGAIK